MAQNGNWLIPKRVGKFAHIAHTCNLRSSRYTGNNTKIPIAYPQILKNVHRKKRRGKHVREVEHDPERDHAAEGSSKREEFLYVVMFMIFVVRLLHLAKQ